MAPFLGRRSSSVLESTHTTGRKGSQKFKSKHLDNEKKAGRPNNPDVAVKSRRKEDQVNDSDISDGSGTSADDDDDYSSLGNGHGQAHQSLLQMLNAHRNGGEPVRKKRRQDSLDVPPNTQADDPLPDTAEDLQENEDLEAGFEDIDESEHQQDPFLSQFSDREELDLERQIQDVKEPRYRSESLKDENGTKCISKVPETSDGPAFFGTLPTIASFHIKHKLLSQGQAALINPRPEIQALTAPLLNYRDVLFPLRSLSNAQDLRRVAALHVLNHLFKTRDKVMKNTIRVTKNEQGLELECRDQGFTRPKTLVILPTRQSCVRYIDCIVDICRPEQQENRKRFQESYATGEDHFAENKPADFRELFSGNDDDMFRLGLKFTRKTIKFFAQFYNSDIIFASPLGLRMALGADKSKKEDSDFLSSIEILIIDQVDAIAMQNWEHIEYIMDHLNLQPKDAHGCDFSRVRHWYLDGQARYLRQTILFSSFNFPSLNRLFSQRMLNISGKMRYSRDEEGIMIGIRGPSRQIFSRFDCDDPSAESDSRFDFFSATILPSLIKRLRQNSGSSPGTLVFVPEYADFVRLRNHLAGSADSQDVSFASISEYTTVKEVARARSHFMSGRHAMLLYTERAHHFRRYHLKGVKNILMYGLPENPAFYREIAGGFLETSILSGLLTSREASIRVLFCKWDLLKLERIVGTHRYMAMIKDKAGDTFEFS